MADPSIQSLSEEEAIEQIVETVQQAKEGAAPFALVLGSGFSHGLVPTARELVTESLPLWMKSVENNKSFADTQKEIPVDQRAKIAGDFWRVFVKRNSNRGLVLPLDPQTGLPESYSDAYRAVFTPRYTGAVGTPADARNFQRALMRLDKPRLNAAHFLLASLLGVQPGKSRRNELFNASAAFSRLILTTNFDPFLQTALQAVNRLYFMSDTPEVGVGDEIFDDQTDAMHLVYLHGTIHRRSQAATDESIKALKEKNAGRLAPVLKRHGVIVLGYSGWDDAIVEALAACSDFDHRLYWCGRESDPLGKGAFGPRVADILRKPSALYVQTAGAGQFMAKLCIRLVKGLPLLDNPIAQLREMLETIDLTELKNLVTAQPVASSTPHLIDIASNTEAFVQAQKLTLQRLREVEQVFRGPVAPPAGETVPTPTEDGKMSAAASVDLKRQIHQLLSSAQVAAALGNYAEALKLCNEALNLAPLEPADLANLWLVQGRAHYSLGHHEEAILSLSQIAELPGAPVEQLANALGRRGDIWFQRGEMDKALADFTRVIEQLRHAPVEQVAAVLTYRAMTWVRQGETEKALADFTRVIEQFSGASDERVADALVRRGIIWELQGETEKALSDFTRVIEQLPGVSDEQLADALGRRGATWTQQGEAEKALADFTRVIDQLPSTSGSLVADILGRRGIIWVQKGEAEKALADFTRVIDQLPDAPTEQVALALGRRGATWSLQGETEKALSDFTRVIEQLPGAPTEQVALALLSRSASWIQQGEAEKALADLTRVIDQVPDAPVEQTARALSNRAGIWAQLGETEKAVADYTRLIEQFPNGPDEAVAMALVWRGWWNYLEDDFFAFLADTEVAVEKLPSFDIAAFNLGLALLACGRDADALKAYRRAGKQFPQSIETNGLANLEEAKKKWLGNDRAQPVIQLLRSLKK